MAIEHVLCSTRFMFDEVEVGGLGVDSPLASRGVWEPPGLPRTPADRFCIFVAPSYPLLWAIFPNFSVRKVCVFSWLQNSSWLPGQVSLVTSRLQSSCVVGRLFG